MARSHGRVLLISGALAAALFVATLADRAHATVMVELSLDELIADATVIVQGVVERTGVQVSVGDRGVLPSTTTRVRVRRWLKGPAPRERVTIREAGGAWPGGGMHVAGTPRYRVGEELVVFLEPAPDRPGALRTVGMAQGKLVVLYGVGDTPSMVRRDVRDLAFARFADGAMTVGDADGGPAMQLDELVALIRRATAIPSVDGSDAEALGGGR